MFGTIQLKILTMPLQWHASQLNYEQARWHTLEKWMSNMDTKAFTRLVNAKKSFRLWLDEVESAPFTICFSSSTGTLSFNPGWN